MVDSHTENLLCRLESSKVCCSSTDVAFDDEVDDNWLSLGLATGASATIVISKKRKQHPAPSIPIKASRQGSNALEKTAVHTLVHLFTKVLTKSDTSKLNRLLVSKKDAERCFPPIDKTRAFDGEEVTEDRPSSRLLRFEDEGGKAWEFKYTHWDSSQGNVFTTGWITYVRKNQLRPGDEVSFLQDPGIVTLV